MLFLYLRNITAWLVFLFVRSTVIRMYNNYNNVLECIPIHMYNVRRTHVYCTSYTVRRILYSVRRILYVVPVQCTTGID